VRPRATPIVLLASALAGCGGDDEAAAPATSAAPPPASSTLPAVRSEPAPAVDLARERRLAARRAVLRVRRTAQRDDRATARRVATQIAEAAGVTDVTISGREALTVRGKAECGVESEDVQRRIATALRPLRVATVELSADCALDAPSGPGKLLLGREGEGLALTDAVRVGRRWAVEYAGRGRFVQVVVERDGEVVARLARGLSGRRTFRGPGTVRLHVAGDGPWVVRLRRG
jgi:hypothetical protein